MGILKDSHVSWVKLLLIGEKGISPHPQISLTRSGRLIAGIGYEAI